MKISIKLNGMYLHEFTPNERYEEPLRGIQTERYSGAEFDPITARGYLNLLVDSERWGNDRTNKDYVVSTNYDD